MHASVVFGKVMVIATATAMAAQSLQKSSSVFIRAQFTIIMFADIECISFYAIASFRWCGRCNRMGNPNVRIASIAKVQNCKLCDHCALGKFIHASVVLTGNVMVRQLCSVLTLTLSLTLL